MTYLKMDGVKLRPFSLMEPLEDELTDEVLNEMVAAPNEDGEGAH